MISSMSSTIAAAHLIMGESVRTQTPTTCSTEKLTGTVAITLPARRRLDSARTRHWGQPGRRGGCCSGRQDRRKAQGGAPRRRARAQALLHAAAPATRPRHVPGAPLPRLQRGSLRRPASRSAHRARHRRRARERHSDEDAAEHGARSSYAEHPQRVRREPCNKFGEDRRLYGHLGLAI
jgi:hypothetical protein